MADLNTLIENLKAEDYYSRASAARALGELGGKEAIAALIEALGDEDDWVKEYAAEALGKLAHGPAVGPIGQLLKSDNYKIRSSAVAALGVLLDVANRDLTHDGLLQFSGRALSVSRC